MSFNIALSGIQAINEQLNTLSNNIANAGTYGFKSSRANFSSVYAGDMANGVQVGLLTQDINKNGSLQTTSQPLDVAISGNGFLQVLRPNGEPAYTRAGQLKVDPNGTLTNAQGLAIVPQITIPQNASGVTIGENGVVSVTFPNQPAPQEIGQINLTAFINPTGLLALGDNLFQETAASGAPNEGRPGDAAFGTLKQGALEGSNVQVVEEMVDMIAAQRTYEMNTKVLSAADNMLQYLSQAAR